MKDFLCGWIIIQLTMIGLAGAEEQRKIADGTLSCAIEVPSPLEAVMFPLGFFLPEVDRQHFCNK